MLESFGDKFGSVPTVSFKTNQGGSVCVEEGHSVIINLFIRLKHSPELTIENQELTRKIGLLNYGVTRYS
jgi:hypothetical protein